MNEIRLEFSEEDEDVEKSLGGGCRIKYRVDLESVFKLIPEVNITQLATLINMNPGLLRQYVSGAKKASEDQTKKVMKGIKLFTEKLNSIQLAVSFDYFKWYTIAELTSIPYGCSVSLKQT